LQPLPILDHVWLHITMNFVEGLSNSSDVAQSFLNNLFKLHGFPPHDLIFEFWQDLMAYHPRIDDQTVIVNRCVGPVAYKLELQIHNVFHIS